MTVGQKIRKYRIMRNMTLSELGEKVGFSKVTAKVRISQYESGKMIPKADILQKIANGLEVHISALADIDINTEEDIIRTLFEFEERLNIEVVRVPGKTSIVFNDDMLPGGMLSTYLYAWASKRNRLPEYNLADKQSIKQHIDYNVWKANFPNDINRFLNDNLLKVKDKYDEKASQLALEKELVPTFYDFVEIIMRMIDNGIHPDLSLGDRCLIISFMFSEMMSDDKHVSDSFTVFMAANNQMMKMGLPISTDMKFSEKGEFIAYIYPMAELEPLESIIKEYNRHLEQDKDDWLKDMYELQYAGWKKTYNMDLREAIQLRFSSE